MTSEENCELPLLERCWNNTIISSIKPTLKKVSKYENKFAKLQKKVSYQVVMKRNNDDPDSENNQYTPEYSHIGR